LIPAMPNGHELVNLETAFSSFGKSSSTHDPHHYPYLSAVMPLTERLLTLHKHKAGGRAQDASWATTSANSRAAGC
jgi:hypothetical protein